MPVAAPDGGMADQRRCIRCERAIDASARICPYCNWDQSNANAPAPETAAEPLYVPRPERPIRKYLMIGAGALVLVVVAFALGAHVLGTAAAPPTATSTATSGTDNTSTAPVKPAPHPDITLVSSTATSGISPSLEAPITSAPLATASNGATDTMQRTDATAVSSVEYAQLAAREQAERKKAQPLVDPRTITSPAYQQGQQPQQTQQPQISSAPEAAARPPAPQAARVTRTQPEPQYQPVPDVQVSQMTTVRLVLTVGADGRVKEVDVSGGGIEGQTGRIVQAVQSWRFKPATENGLPVQSTFSTALSFHPNQ
ncbi:MAG TPA: energy transducer TonB [Thermoanaerobaculia bacterium]|nr:energy transducer TonB [Thermoanaerobaculia bacterium]